MENYLILLCFALLCLGLAGVLLLVSSGLDYFTKDVEKLTVYECGFSTFGEVFGIPFNIHFYLVGIVFIIFDLEVVFLFPWSLVLLDVGWYGLFLVVVFLSVVFLGLLYEWLNGVLKWSP